MSYGYFHCSMLQISMAQFNGAWNPDGYGHDNQDASASLVYSETQTNRGSVVFGTWLPKSTKNIKSSGCLSWWQSLQSPSFFFFFNNMWTTCCHAYFERMTGPGWTEELNKWDRIPQYIWTWSSSSKLFISLKSDETVK